MTTRLLVRSGMIAAAVLVALNVTGCFLARVHSTGDMYILPLQGARHVIDIGVGNGVASISTPSIVLGDSAFGVFYPTSSSVASNKEWLPFCVIAYYGEFALVSIAYWPLILSAGMPTGLVLLASRCRRFQRRRDGLCLQCGYSLAGNVSGKCPECSTAVVARRIVRLGRRGRTLKWCGVALVSLIALASVLSNCQGHGHLIRWKSTAAAVPWYWPRAFVTYCGDAWAYVNLPLWVPTLFVAIPTAFLWFMDRSHLPAYCCQGCGYDLTGNTSGRCPECGEALPTDHTD